MRTTTQPATRLGEPCPDLKGSDGKPPQRWTEILNDWLYVYEGEPDVGHAKRRIVRVKDLRPLAKRQKAAGIPEIYQEAILATWPDERANPGARELIGEFLGDPSHALYLWGRVGVGKTYLACAILNGLLDRGRSALFKSFSRLLLDLRMTFNSEGLAEGEILHPLFETDLLLLDEVGDVEFNSNTQASHFTASRLLLVLDQRAQTKKPTIMTSNASLDELVRWSGDERIGSRIRGICGESGIVELSGRDLRFDRNLEEVAVHHETATVP